MLSFSDLFFVDPVFTVRLPFLTSGLGNQVCGPVWTSCAARFYSVQYRKAQMDHIASVALFCVPCVHTSPWKQGRVDNTVEF